MSTCVTFGLLILAAAIIVYTMIKNVLISAAVGVIGEVILVIVYLLKSSIFEGGIQKVLDIFNLSDCSLLIPYNAVYLEETLELGR